MQNTIVTITGPSCSGKTTLTNMLKETGKFTEVISTTTRQPRSGEVNGETYHFVTLEEFKKIEMLENVEFNGNYYGGSVKEFEDKFKSELIPIKVVEPNGMMEINNNAKNKDWIVINVFLDCPVTLQAERFLERFYNDVKQISILRSITVFRNIVKDYAKRMVQIVSTEKEWVNMFNKDKNNLKLYFYEFSEKTENHVIHVIQESIQKIGKESK